MTKEEKKPSFAKATEGKEATALPSEAPSDSEERRTEDKKELNTEAEAKVEKKESSSNFAKLKKKLEECQKLKDEYLAGWQRSRADLLNYKKEEMERIGEFAKYADVGLILKILPILDNFELVEKKLPENLKENENVKGLLQIRKQLHDFLKNQGVEEIKCLGGKFDPNFQEIVEMVEPASVPPASGASAGKSDIIVEEVQKGYKLQGKVIRPAKVRISK